MPEMKNPAALREKIVISGEFQLDAPLRIGSGENGATEADTYVLKNRDQNPIIPGSSLAGVLRAACKDWDIVDILFGSDHEEVSHNRGTVRQSAIDVNDIILEDFDIAIRDGVAINTQTGTAVDGSKHNYESIDSGAHGSLSLVIAIRREQSDLLAEIEEVARKIAAFLAQGLRLGSLTTKGFGLGHCPQVTIDFYDMTSPAAVKAWLLKEACATETVTAEDRHFYHPADFVVDMELAINGSLIIRHATDKKRGDMPIKAEQLQHRGKDDQTEYYIIPGTSLKGVLRHQAIKILQRLGQEQRLLDDLMGSAGQKIKSRLIVNEVHIDKNAGVHEHIQARNSLDRFTGGVMPSKLFGENPIWQDDAGKSPLKLHMEINPDRATGKQRSWDLGLVMFLIKDLCLGQIALGGEKSIGRGTLKGHKVVIHYGNKVFAIDAEGRVMGDDASDRLKDMEDWANAFLEGQAGE